jgi:hypothetical protein
MGILRFIERFFPKVFIGIWTNKGRHYLHIRKVLPSGSTKNESISFDKDAEEDKFLDHLAKIQKNNIVTYIASLDQSLYQGAVPTINEIRYIEFSSVKNIDDFEDLLFQKGGENWTLFTKKTELIQHQNRFKKVGIDYIFSPFHIPMISQKKFKLSTNTSLFVVAEKDISVISIFKNNQLLFASKVEDIDSNEISIEESKNELAKEKVFEFGKLDKEIDKRDKFKNQSSSAFFDEGETIEFDIDDKDLNDFLKEDSEKNSIEDELNSFNLDKNSGIDEFDEISLERESESKKSSFAEIEKFLNEDMEEEILEEKRLAQEFEIDYNLVYSAIKRGVHSFYHENLYQSDFIENCYILTSLKVENNFIQKIETEFSFETEKIRVDLSEIVTDLIGEELGTSKI